MGQGTIRLSGVVRQSIVDGPGLRFTVFTQGCPHHCAGCHNPQTHDFSGGYDGEIDALLREIDKNPLLRGVTLTGGEPFSRAAELLPFVREVRRRGKDVVCYSGYTFEELLEMAKTDPDIGELLELLDVLVDGRFELSQRDLTLPFRGSTNQRLLDVPLSLQKGEAVGAAGIG
jgi:anaerobic ribonucleoside-triphosphate reductase activating protein